MLQSDSDFLLFPYVSPVVNPTQKTRSIFWKDYMEDIGKDLRAGHGNEEIGGKAGNSESMGGNAGSNL
jgi:hypothetical protein